MHNILLSLNCVFFWGNIFLVTVLHLFINVESLLQSTDSIRESAAYMNDNILLITVSTDH